MGRLNAVLRRFRSASILGGGLVLLTLFIFLPLTLQSQASASLHGTVRDSQGKPVAGATVQLQAKDKDKDATQTAHTDSQGNYSFAALPGGAYLLRAEMAGYRATEIPSLFLGPKESNSVDLILLPANAPPSQPISPRAAEFFDQPQFTVAGVTDTTNIGGHGSNTIVRTGDTLAKETVSLGKTPAGAQPVAPSDGRKIVARERRTRAQQL